MAYQKIDSIHELYVHRYIRYKKKEEQEWRMNRKNGMIVSIDYQKEIIQLKNGRLFWKIRFPIHDVYMKLHVYESFLLSNP